MMSRIEEAEMALAIAHKEIPPIPPTPADFRSLKSKNAFKPKGEFYQKVLEQGDHEAQFIYVRDYYHSLDPLLEHEKKLKQIWKKYCNEHFAAVISPPSFFAFLKSVHLTMRYLTLP